MATYLDLFNVHSNDDLRNRIAIACIVAADAIRTEAPTTVNHANRMLWAKRVFEDPNSVASSMLWALLAANKGASIANIENASDNAIQSNVNDAIEVFATGA